jgi:hypothetical protein
MQTNEPLAAHMQFMHAPPTSAPPHLSPALQGAPGAQVVVPVDPPAPPPPLVAPVPPPHGTHINVPSAPHRQSMHAPPTSAPPHFSPAVQGAPATQRAPVDPPAPPVVPPVAPVPVPHGPQVRWPSAPHMQTVQLVDEPGSHL